MIENRSGIERRSQTSEQLELLVATRTETLALYSELACRRPYAVDHCTARAVQRFCQALIDYTASAHFKLYRHLSESTERRQAVLRVAERAYPAIVKTTDFILAFNDKYATSTLADGVAELADDLSDLGEMLADRIQLEDQVIAAMSSEERRSRLAAAVS